MPPLRIILHIFLALGAATPAACGLPLSTTSGAVGAAAWGLRGERWNRNVLLDWSWTGYASKERPYPSPAIVANVLDFGARGNGETDDTGPLLAAIAHAAARGGGAVLLPAGRYRVTQRITISSSNVVLQGQGPQRTTILGARPLAEIDGRNIAKWRVLPGRDSPYSWADGLVQLKGKHMGSSDRTTLLAPVVLYAPMGSRKLVLSSVRGVVPGMWVRLWMSDFNGTLVRDLYGGTLRGLMCGPSCSSDLTGQRDLVSWVVRVAAVAGDTVTLQRPLPIKVHSRAELHRVPSSVPREVGIKDLTVEFRWAPSDRHHLERGRNAILVEGVVNAFVTNVAVVNVDSGVLVSQSALVSVDGLTVRSSAPRGGAGPSVLEGHLGVGVDASSDVEVANFYIQGSYTHDLAVRNTMLTVFHHGAGANLLLDLHRSAPYATLYSDLDLGAGRRPWGTGGYVSRGFPAGAFTTYYNVRPTDGGALAMPGHTVQGNCTYGVDVNFLGTWDGSVPCGTYYAESFHPGTLQPPNLYASMIDKKYSDRATQLPQVLGVDPALQVGPLPVGGDGTYPLITVPDIY